MPVGAWRTTLKERRTAKAWLMRLQRGTGANKDGGWGHSCDILVNNLCESDEIERLLSQSGPLLRQHATVGGTWQEREEGLGS